MIPDSETKKFVGLDGLVMHILDADKVLQTNVKLVINRHVTARAWLIGYYIVEYEQNGSDRAQYGENLIFELSRRLGRSRYSTTTLKVYRQFYLQFPMLADVISNFLSTNMQIGQSVTDQLQITCNKDDRNSVSLVGHPFDVNRRKTNSDVYVSPDLLFNKLSFTHLAAIIPISDPLQRAFYEIMAIRGTWSARELQRQIDSNYYARSGWSANPEQLAKLVNENAEIASIATELKSPFVFEFLGLKAKDVVEESYLESAILDHLQDFILELGLGFCFESRQYKMLIDDRYYKADLVFYHRVLKRHVIIELKANRLGYADVAQLNMYLAYWRKNVMLHDDNEPIGILMCTEVGQEMAEYATIGIDPNLFISKYQLELPSRERIADFLRKENAELQNSTQK